MGFGTIVFIFVLVIVVVLVIVQVQIRKHFSFQSSLGPEDVLQAAAAAIGGGRSFVDASGSLSIPLDRERILSVAAQPSGDGSMVEIWLSHYDFINANGFQVLRYNGQAKRIMRACGAEQVGVQQAIVE